MASRYIPKQLRDTEPLAMQSDLAAAMVAGIDRFLTRETEIARQSRVRRPADEARKRLAEMLGIVDVREGAGIEMVAPADGPVEVGTGEGYRIFEVRWPVFAGVEGEGLMLAPDRPPVASVIALPDCDVSPEQFSGLDAGLPEMAQVARRLVESGCRVLVPVLMDRQCTHSGHPEVRMTNQPHREFIYRAAYELGRHVIGYEVQKVLAAVDAFSALDAPIGVFGYGEGGLLALYASALDVRIRATAVSGYFGPREALWAEPIYRNVFGLLRDFGDAELAALIAPRTLVVEVSDHPWVAGPPEPTDKRKGAAPGRVETPPAEAVEAEFNRALSLLNAPAPFSLTRSAEETLRGFLKAFDQVPGASGRLPECRRTSASQEARFKRQFDQMMAHTQCVLREAEFCRAAYWAEADAADLASWETASEVYRRRLWEDVIGPLPEIAMPPNPRTRLFYDDPKLTAYEVALDVYPDVFAYGILLVPKRIRKGARRPVVVCQHGLEGRAQTIVDPDGPLQPYRKFAYDLAREGFVTYAPQNPYIGGDAFRALQRKANPLKLSLFSFIVRQHEQTLRWLAGLPFVDAKRIGFYGISYGGKTAMRVPALLKQYCLSICSADFNEWIWKNASARHKYSYLFTGEYEMPEFNLGNTFNYAEMSRLIFPRPFMVERGHHDGVAPDEWVAYEYAKARRHYVMMGLEDRIEIAYFNGPHTIHGQGTFAFLRKHLKVKAVRSSECGVRKGDLAQRRRGEEKAKDRAERRER